MTLAEARVLAPVSAPATVVVVGFNYRTHVAETGAALPAAPPLAVLPAGPGVTAAWNDDVELPASAPAQVDYEGELAVVIGRPARAVRAADAWRYVGGLTVVNDLSARDVQRRAMSERDPALGLGKLFPGFKPCGPALVTLDELGADSLDLELETRVNGELRQRARTSELLFPIPALLEAATRDAPSGRPDLHGHTGRCRGGERDVPEAGRRGRGAHRRDRRAAQSRGGACLTSTCPC
jgi:2-keto-4-pentenoate hydratase/2-oxohepta-3-ene-1,7-dioic acid hydratase in catechol pathway